MDKNYVYELFEYLHSVPENGFQEYKTSERLGSELKKHGYSVTENVGGTTGLIGVLDSGTTGPTVALRADMDALQYENNGVTEYRHTCGHDAHSAMVMAAAKELSEEGIKRGKLVIIFQPAEEKLTGALAMIDSGMLNDIGTIIGIHLRPRDEVPFGCGSPAIYHGASGPVKVTVRGKSAHGARLHQGINAIEAAMLAINAVNSVRVDPSVSHSAKVTKFSGGTSFNTIPDMAEFYIDMRCQQNDVMDAYRDMVRAAVENSVKAIGAKAEVELMPYVPAAEYDDDVKEDIKDAICHVLGEDNLYGDIKSVGGEDFHYYRKFLGCQSGYIGLGADVYPGLHHQDMSFNHKCMEYGVEILKKVAQARMRK